MPKLSAYPIYHMTIHVATTLIHLELQDNCNFIFVFIETMGLLCFETGLHMAIVLVKRLPN